jgi:hypothetical protein
MPARPALHANLLYSRLQGPNQRRSGTLDGASGGDLTRRATFSAALECAAELVTRAADNCLAAVHLGIIPLLTSYISAHTNPPPNPAALRILYQLVTCAPHRDEVYDGVLSCLTIPALAHLLDASLLHAGPEHCGARRS